MIKNEVSEIKIMARKPQRTCDGCGKSDEDTAPAQVYARAGVSDVYEATRPPPDGWNTIRLARPGAADYEADLCPPCSAGAVLACRRAATDRQKAAQARAGHPVVVSIDSAGRTAAVPEAPVSVPTAESVAVQAPPAAPPKPGAAQPQNEEEASEPTASETDETKSSKANLMVVPAIVEPKPKSAQESSADGVEE